MQCIHESNAEREEKVFSKRKMMCFGWLQPMEDWHNETPCKKILLFTTCKEKHPTTLHGYIPKNKKFFGDRN